MQFLICLRHKCGYRCFWICKTNVKSRLRECPQHPHMYITCTFGVVQKGRCPLSLPHPPYKICKFPAENVSTLTELLRYSCCLSNSSIIQEQGRELHQVPWTCIELHQVLFSPHVASLGHVSYSYHIFKHTKKCTDNSLLIQERCSSFKDGHKKYIEDPLTKQLLTSWNPFVKLIQETEECLKSSGVREDWIHIYPLSNTFVSEQTLIRSIVWLAASLCASAFCNTWNRELFTLQINSLI